MVLKVGNIVKTEVKYFTLITEWVLRMMGGYALVIMNSIVNIYCYIDTVNKWLIGAFIPGKDIYI